MMYICPDCGVVDIGNGTCQELFESFLALEFTDPAYGEVHFLTVGTYMVQHNRYSAEARDWVCRNMRAWLDGTRSVEEIRGDVKIFEGTADRKNILRSPEEPPVSQIKWDMTIADVANAYDGPAGYQEQIRRWAELSLLQIGY